MRRYLVDEHIGRNIAAIFPSAQSRHIGKFFAITEKSLLIDVEDILFQERQIARKRLHQIYLRALLRGDIDSSANADLGVKYAPERTAYLAAVFFAGVAAQAYPLHACHHRRAELIPAPAL